MAILLVFNTQIKAKERKRGDGYITNTVLTTHQHLLMGHPHQSTGTFNQLIAIVHIMPSIQPYNNNNHRLAHHHKCYSVHDVTFCLVLQ